MGELTRIERIISYDNEEDYNFGIVNLLHELEFCKSEEEYQKLAYAEPRPGLSDNWFNYVFIAGCIEFFGYRHKWMPPDWVRDEKYVIEEPWFAVEDEPKWKARCFLLGDKCFSKRNIFIEAYNLIPM